MKQTQRIRFTKQKIDSAQSNKQKKTELEMNPLTPPERIFEVLSEDVLTNTRIISIVSKPIKVVDVVVQLD